MSEQDPRHYDLSRKCPECGKSPHHGHPTTFSHDEDCERGRAAYDATDQATRTRAKVLLDRTIATLRQERESR